MRTKILMTMALLFSAMAFSQYKMTIVGDSEVLTIENQLNGTKATIQAAFVVGEIIDDRLYIVRYSDELKKSVFFKKDGFLNGQLIGPDDENFASLALAKAWLDDRVGKSKASGGSGGTGSQGPQGDSAYEVAVSEGFVGTEPEWLDSLQGADGADGQDGADGAGSSGISTVQVTDSVYTLLNTDKGKIHEFHSDAESIDVSLPETPDDDAEWTIAQMTAGNVGITSLLKNGPNVDYYRTSDGGKYMTIYSVADTTLLRVVGGIESFVYGDSGSASVAVAAGSDDGAQNISAGFMTNTSTDYTLEANTIYFARFLGLNIPDGATITSATIQLEGRFTSSGTPANILITTQKGVDPAAVTTTGYDITNRTQTTASTDWSVPAWFDGENGPDTLSDDFSTSLQETVDHPAYNSTHAIGVILNGDDSANGRRFKAFEFSTGIPVLSVTWTVE